MTGHVAESVVEMMLVEGGYAPLAHHVGPGRHGVDLIMLHLTSEMVFATEVKGTLRARRIPRLTPAELDQMTDAWVDKADNPAMSGTDLRSADVYGALATVNFADMTLRVALTNNFRTFLPVTHEDQLDEPSWLARPTPMKTLPRLAALFALRLRDRLRTPKLSFYMRLMTSPSATGS